MKQKLLKTALALTPLGIFGVVGAQDSQQPYDNPVPVQTSMNEIMVMAVDYAAHWIWDAQEEPPATEEDWFRIRVHATQLVALGSTIALGGTGVADNGWVRSPEWARDAQALVDAGHDALEAAENQNVNALSAAADRLVEVCESCHDTFKPEVPTEGLLHRDVHREARRGP
jgi:hypothetical protein